MIVFNRDLSLIRLPLPRPGEFCPEVDLSGSATTSNEFFNHEPVIVLTLDEKKALAVMGNYDGSITAAVPVIISGNRVNITLTGELVNSLAEKDSYLKVVTPKAEVKIPAEQIHIRELAERLDSNVSDLTVNIGVSGTNTGETGMIVDLAARNGFTLLAEPVKFKIEAGTGGRSIPVEMFDRYVEYTVFLENGAGLGETGSSEAGSSEAGCGAAATSAATGELLLLPTRISVENGKRAVIIKSRMTNTYAVVRSNREFRDMENHWAKEEVGTLASGLIVSGNGNGLFAPESGVTRAQFAAIITRALGLGAEWGNRQGEGTETRIKFSDISETAWYAPAVEAAAAEGLITGYPDGTFRPGNYIRREEAAVLIMRALAMTVTETVFDGNRPLQNISALSRFKDGNSVSAWARSSVTGSIACGIVRGDADGCFVPDKFVTRAEAAVMVRRMLSKAGFM